MKKNNAVILIALLFINLPANSRADYLFIDQKEVNPAFSGGAGTNWVEVIVDSTPQADDLRLFSIEFSRRTNSVKRLQLPNILNRRACEFKRTINGTPNDYKPAVVQENLRITYTGGATLLLGLRYPETANPYTHLLRFRNYVSQVDTAGNAKIAEFCSSGVTSVRLSFASNGICRWSTAAGILPSTFPQELVDLRYAMVFFNVKLKCVD